MLFQEIVRSLEVFSDLLLSAKEIDTENLKSYYESKLDQANVISYKVANLPFKELNNLLISLKKSPELKKCLIITLFSFNHKKVSTKKRIELLDELLDKDYLEEIEITKISNQNEVTIIKIKPIDEPLYDLDTPLHLAIKSNSLELVKLLIERKKAHLDDIKDITLAALLLDKQETSQSSAILNYLINYSKNTLKTLETILNLKYQKSLVIEENKKESIHIRINEEIDSILSNLFKSRPYIIHSAVKNGYLEVVKSLLDSGADPNIKDQTGNTLLNKAIEQDNIKMAKHLITHGANVRVKNDSGYTPNINDCITNDLFQADLTKFHPSIFTKKIFINRLLNYIINNFELSLATKHQYLSIAYDKLKTIPQINKSIWFSITTALMNIEKQTSKEPSIEIMEIKNVDILDKEPLPSKPDSISYQEYHYCKSSLM